MTGRTDMQAGLAALQTVLAKFKPGRFGLTAPGSVWDELHESCEPEVIAALFQRAAAAEERAARAEAQLLELHGQLQLQPNRGQPLRASTGA